MLTRLKVNGFKNLVDVDLSFGPFTCIAGVNGVGKSNLFDAILFLSFLMDKPLLEAALSVRSEGGRTADLRSIFRRVGEHTEPEMSFEVEMLIPPTGVDNLGQEAKAATTFLRYQLTLSLTESGLSVRQENLNHITQGEARSHLPFPHSPAWRKSVVQGRRTSPFISTDSKEGHIVLHQDQGSDYKGGGRPRRFVAEKLPRTVLSEVNAAESATAVLARQEIQSWRVLQLEPSALRSPDSFTAQSSMASNGAHMPATLARLADLEINPGRLHSTTALPREENAALYSRVANRLAELIEEVRSIRVDVDERRELLTLMLRDRQGTEYDARSLSDGTLRFLALAILEADSQARGVLCMEEPENGIHPQRIPAMLRLLQDLAVDPESDADEDNPLRQVIVNTHSPGVAGLVPEGSLLVALPRAASWNGRSTLFPIFCGLPDTWRAQADPEEPTVPLGELVSYLSAFLPPGRVKPPSALRRVVDREDVQPWLPLSGEPSTP